MCEPKNVQEATWIFLKEVLRKMLGLCVCVPVCCWGAAGRGVVRGVFEGALAYNGIGVCMQ